MQSLQLVDLFTLALVEGVADILPIDSTGHALLATWLLQWRAGQIGIAIHFGTVLALTLYLWRDIGQIGLGLWHLARRRRVDLGTRLLGKAVGVALPWIVVSAVVGPRLIPSPGSAALVGGVTIISALAMIAVDRMSMTVMRVEHIALAGVVTLGVAQLVGLIPGVGRMVALAAGARFLGLERAAAFRFALLVQIPVLLAQGGGSGLSYYLQGARPSDGDLLAALVTFVVVLPAVALGAAIAGRSGLVPFALYRLLVGAALIGVVFL